jgi:galactokinase
MTQRHLWSGEMDLAAHFDGAAATLEVFAPGRVNLIGEHTDYNDLPVLPMALERGVRVRLRPRDDGRVRLANADARFGRREFELSAALEPGPQGDWGNYAMAAARILAAERGLARGFDACVSSDLPAAAGLSSSSALVVACGLALCAANHVAVDTLEMAELMARGERFVGTHSGGMDQAISLAARAGHALRIEFRPLRATPVAVPEGWQFVVAHSLVMADKSGSARQAYNERRAQCEDALRRITGQSELAGEPASYPALLARHGAEKLSWIAQRELAGDALRRFRHQISEATRVEQARAAMLAGDAARFGQLMDESHASLAEDYDVSHAELDALVERARAAGALGARLTGAGFGGCAVLLARPRAAPELVERLRGTFYASRALPRDVAEPLMIATPGAGARVRSL